MRRTVRFTGALICACLLQAAAGMAAAQAEEPIPLEEYDLEQEYDRDDEEDSLVSFGTFEQDNDSSNGAEPIAWYVPRSSIYYVDGDENVQEHAVMLASARCLNAMEPAWSGTDWSTLNIRNWLVSDFFKTAFTQEEQSRIMYADLRENSTELYWDEEKESSRRDEDSVDPGERVGLDRVFLFSWEEMDLLRPSSFQVTPYAKSKGIVTDSEDICWGALRELSDGTISVGTKSGEFNADSDMGSLVGVIPGIWVYLDEVCSEKETIVQVQTALNENGYECGAADGLVGRKTAEAIKKYQADHKMMPSGLVTRILVDDLLGESPQSDETAPASAPTETSASTPTPSPSPTPTPLPSPTPMPTPEEDFTFRLAGEDRIDLSKEASSAWIEIETDLEDLETVKVVYDKEHLFLGKPEQTQDGWRYSVFSLKHSSDWMSVEFYRNGTEELLTVQVKP